VKLSFKHRSSALVYKNMSSRSCANMRGRIGQRYALVVAGCERKSVQKSRRKTMRMTFVTLVCSAVLPVAASLLVQPAAAQRACGGYGPQGWWCGQPSCGGYGPQDPRCYGDYRPRYGYYERREREERRERRRRDFYEDRRYYWR
jgi:hypothetical protein